MTYERCDWPRTSDRGAAVLPSFAHGAGANRHAAPAVGLKIGQGFDAGDRPEGRPPAPRRRATDEGRNYRPRPRSARPAPAPAPDQRVPFHESGFSRHDAELDG